MNKKILGFIVLISYFIVSIFVLIGTFLLFSVMTQEYNLTTNSNNVDIGEVTFINSKHKKGETFTLVASKKNNDDLLITFEGWYIEEELISPHEIFVFTMPNHHVEITGKFSYEILVKISKYTLEFDTKSDDFIEPITKYENEKHFKPRNPIKENSIFDGWYLEEEFLTPISWPLSLTEDTTIYAKWKAKEYEISWNINGEIFKFDYNAGIIPSFEGPLIKQEDDQYYYEFSGWYPSLSVVNSDAIYTAQFDKKLKTYNVTWEIDGLETTIEYNYGDFPTYTGDIIKEATNEYSYIFKGWSPIISNVKSDITYLAQFTEVTNSYQLKFNSNGGTTLSFIEGIYEELIGEPTNPTRTGYEFSDWYSDENFLTPISWPLSLTKNTTIYAKWEKLTYNIIYILNGGSNNISNPGTYTIEDRQTVLSDPYLEGYEFDGWYSNNKYDNQIFTISGELRQDIILYAKWIINNENKAIINNFETLENNTKGIKVPNQQKTFNFNNYIETDSFSSWTISLDINGNNIISSKNVDLLIGDNNYYLNVYFDNNVYQSLLNVRRKPIYILNYYSNDIIYKTFEIEEDETTNTPTNPTRIGYTFDGWDQSVPSTMPASDLTITAIWKINEYTITFNSAGGSAVAAITQNYATSIKAPGNPTRIGYTFDGWDQSVPSTMPASDLTITAIWKINEYTITFNSAGGSAVAPIKQDYATSITAPTNPTRTGYTFNGWDQPIPLTMPASDLTITAQWTINEYTITFDTAGGSAVAPIKQDYATSITAPTNPTRMGYTFNGWDQSVPSTMPASNLTITAQWILETYDITYALEGGTNNGSNPSTYTIETQTITFQEPIKIGYTFVGWYDSQIGGNTVINISVGSTGNKTIYARWQENELVLVYENIEGALKIEGDNPGTYYYESLPKVVANYTRDGYVFLGWDSDGDGIVDYDINSNIPKTLLNNSNASLILIAIWEDE